MVWQEGTRPRQGKAGGLGAGLGNWSRHRGIGLSSGMVGTGDTSPGVSEPNKGGSWGVGSGLVGLPRKGGLPGELLAISGHLLLLAGPSLRGGRGPDVKAWETQGGAKSRFRPGRVWAQSSFLPLTLRSCGPESRTAAARGAQVSGK